MMTVMEVSEKTGVSIRTLHYYDQIGLLRPDGTTEAGYRLYSRENLKRLQEILLLRELEFPLKAIARILDDPQTDKIAAMDQQIRLLTMKRNRLSAIISIAERIKKGEDIVDLKAFDKSHIDKYAEEAKQRWGDTEAYKESEKRTGLYGQEQWNAAVQEAYAAHLDPAMPPEQRRAAQKHGQDCARVLCWLADFAGMNHRQCMVPWNDDIKTALIRALLQSNSAYAALMWTELFDIPVRLNTPGTEGGPRMPFTAAEAADLPQSDWILRLSCDANRAC